MVKVLTFFGLAAVLTLAVEFYARAETAEHYPFDQYAVKGLHKGEPKYPDFKNRDRDFSAYRTRIRDGLRRGPNFAGRYSLIVFGCGTDCSDGYLTDVSTGKVYALPLRGEEYMDLRLKFQLHSALIVARWYDLQSKRCYEEMFAWRGERFDQMAKKDVGDHDFCLLDWPFK